jgi:superfamily II RNA helicase
VYGDLLIQRSYAKTGQIKLPLIAFLHFSKQYNSRVIRPKRSASSQTHFFISSSARFLPLPIHQTISLLSNILAVHHSGSGGGEERHED